MTEQQTREYGAQIQAAIQQTPEGADHSELSKMVAGLQARVDQKAEEIRSDRRLDKSEQRQKMSELWDLAQGAHAEVIAYYEEQLQEKSTERERTLFSVPSNMRDSLRSAYNDAYDRTQPAFESGEPDGITFAREELERLWERGQRTGDRALLHAIGQLAIERGDTKLRDAYLSWSNEKRQAFERYAEARRTLEDFRDPHQSFVRNMTGHFYLRKPPEAE